MCHRIASAEIGFQRADALAYGVGRAEHGGRVEVGRVHAAHLVLHRFVVALVGRRLHLLPRLRGVREIAPVMAQARLRERQRVRVRRADHQRDADRDLRPAAGVA